MCTIVSLRNGHHVLSPSPVCFVKRRLRCSSGSVCKAARVRALLLACVQQWFVACLCPMLACKQPLTCYMQQAPLSLPAAAEKHACLVQMLQTGMSVAGLRGGQGQTPMISSNYAFDMNTPLQI